MTSKSTTITKQRIVRSGQPWKPHAYQKKALKFLVEHQSAGLLLDPGLGKTSVTLAALSYLQEKKVAGSMLVVAPLRPCYLVWPAEIKEWHDFQHLSVAVMHGRHKEEEKARDVDVYVVNPEGLEWLMGDVTAFKKWMRAKNIDTLVLDELTKWKHPKGKRFKLLKKYLYLFQRRWGLTGTPAPNGLLDLFGQMYMLDSGNALGQYITHYRMNYFVNPDGRGWKWIPQQGAAERIYERIKPLCLRMEAKDYLELPERQDVRLYIDLPPAVVKIYDALEEELIAKIDDGLVVAANAASASSKLRQICNGALYVDDDIAAKVRGLKRAVMEVHDLKLEALDDLVEELQGQPLLVAYEFNHDLDRLLHYFGKDTPYIGSGVTPRKTQSIETAWNAGDIPLLLGQPASMGHGLNFQRGNAAHVAWFSMFWDLELYDQFVKRVLRQGNKAKHVFNYHFITKRPTGATIDEIVWASQRRKERGQQALSDALKDIRNARRS